MDLSQVQAVLLDMDGTLVDSDAAVERSWRTWAAEYPVDPGRGPLIAHGLPALANVRRLRPDLSEDDAAAAARYQLELEYVDVADITAAPGAHELLGELDRLGLPWAVVTSADPPLARARLAAADRKSTRLNSSHGYISYAVFCLKKKKAELRVSHPTEKTEARTILK